MDIDSTLKCLKVLRDEKQASSSKLVIYSCIPIYKIRYLHFLPTSLPFPEFNIN